jgi:hypothetical protein
MKWAAIFFVLLLSLPIWAQDAEYDAPPIVSIPPGPDKITSLKKGDKAPYDGQLFNIDTAIRWGFWLQQYKYRLAADVKEQRHLCEVEKEFKDTALVVEKTRARTVEKDLRDRLVKSEQARVNAEEDARNPPWYSTVEFGIAIGVISTAAVFALAVWAVDAGTGE